MISEYSWNTPARAILVASARETLDDLAYATLSNAFNEQLSVSATNWIGAAARHQKTFALAMVILQEFTRRAEKPDARVLIERLAHLTYGPWMDQRRRLKGCVDIIRSLLNANGLNFAFLRGIVFAETYYRRPELRVSEDIDILIPETEKQLSIEVMISSGFLPVESTECQEARARLLGQIELRHDSGVRVDLNWRLTGNFGVGPLDQDLDLIWERSKHLGSSEFILSVEDSLIEIFRHAAHGHDFMEGLLRAAVDISALIRNESSLDIDYINCQIEELECRRPFSFFAHFFNKVYQAPSPLSFNLGQGRNPFRLESKLFVNTMVLMSVGPTNGSFLGRSFRSLIAKLWMLDKISRLRTLLTYAVIPSSDIVLLETRSIGGKPPSQRRVYYAIFIAINSPAILIGTVAFLLSLTFARTAKLVAEKRER